MKPSEALARADRKEILRIVKAGGASNPRVYGSALYRDDTHRSDLDILVDTDEGTTLLGLGGIQGDLTRLLGVPVDLTTPSRLSRHCKEAVLAEAEPI